MVPRSKWGQIEIQANGLLGARFSCMKFRSDSISFASSLVATALVQSFLTFSEVSVTGGVGSYAVSHHLGLTAKTGVYHRSSWWSTTNRRDDKRLSLPHTRLARYR
jgi:hypothetical protein